MEIKTAYFLIIAIILLAIGITIFGTIQGPRTAFEEKFREELSSRPSFMRVLGAPSLDALGVDDCMNDFPFSCSYPITVKGLVLETGTDASINVTPVITYKDRSILVPCMTATSYSAAGPCAIPARGSGGVVLELDGKIEGFVTAGGTADIPPTINANYTTVLVNKTLYDKQKLLIGNYSIDFTIRHPGTAVAPRAGWFLKDASVEIRCKTAKALAAETSIINFNVGEHIKTVMCGASVDITFAAREAVSIIGTSEKGEFNISVGVVNGAVQGDSVFVSFWNYDQAFRDAGCGGLQSPSMDYDNQTSFDVSAALGVKDCSDRFLGGYEFAIPVRSWSQDWERHWEWFFGEE